MKTTTNQDTDIPADVRAFLESILQDANIATVDDSMRESIIQELFQRLDKFMLTTVVEALPPEKMEDFTKLVQAGKDRSELEGYLKAHIANAQEVFVRAMLAFRDLYLGGIDKAEVGYKCYAIRSSDRFTTRGHPKARRARE